MTTRDIRADVTVKAAPERVWRALTSSRELGRWWGCSAIADPRNGGEVKLRWSGPASDSYPQGLGALEGIFVDLEPGRKVAWIWKLPADLGDVPPLSSVFLTPIKGGCEVTALHSGFEAGAADNHREAFARGWAGALRRLRSYLETRPGGRPARRRVRGG